MADRRRLKSWGKAIVVDVTPIREYRDFRYFFVSRLAFDSGRQLLLVALPLQVYAMTGSSLAVGLIGAAQLVPILTVSLVGGALADALDRRRLLILGQALIGLTCGGLGLYAGSAPTATWPVYVLAATFAGLSAMVQPTRTAVLPTLVENRSLPSALALNQVLSNVTKAAIPALGGLMVATVDLAWTYVLAAGFCILGSVVVIGIRSLPPSGGRSFGMGSVVEGLRYLRSNRLILSTLVIDLNAMVFGMPTALFPALGTTVFGGGATTVGLLYSAPGTGALIGALTSGWLARIQRQGLAVVTSVVGWGIAIAAFGLTSSLTVALILLALAGAADVISAVFRNSIVQTTVPDRLRGRISATHIATVSSGPRLGDLEAGVVASITTPRVSVVAGGLACALGSLVVARMIPELTGYRPPRRSEPPVSDP